MLGDSSSDFSGDKLEDSEHDNDDARLEDFILVNARHFRKRPLEVAFSLRQHGITSRDKLDEALRLDLPVLHYAFENRRVKSEFQLSVDLSPPW